MEGAVNALTSTVTSASLWSSFTGIVPFLAIIIPFSLAIYFVRRMIKGAANKGKTKI